MIELKLEPYCKNCPMFDAEMKKDICKGYNLAYESVLQYANSVIFCSRKEECHEIYSYLKSQLNNTI